jgi:hypothetical protein
VGAEGQNAAFVYVRQGMGWSLEATLVPVESGTSSYGFSVALSPDGVVALVAASSDCVGGALPPCSSAFAFMRSGSSWSEEKQILDPSAQHGNAFGKSMTLSQDGSTAFIGDPFESCVETATICGVTHVFARNGGAWNLIDTLVTDDIQGQAGFAISLSADASVAVISAPNAPCAVGVQCGAAYIFERNGTTWVERARLAPAESAALDHFGLAVAMSADGNLALVGSPNHDCPGDACGVIYAFGRSGGSWVVQQRFQGSPGQSLGKSLALSAAGDQAFFLSSSSACAFCERIDRARRVGGLWSAPELLADGLPGPKFDPGEPRLGMSRDGLTVAAGSPEAPCTAGGDACGAVYVFALQADIVQVPALGGLGLALFTLLLAAAGGVFLRRRRSA